MTTIYPVLGLVALRSLCGLLPVLVPQRAGVLFQVCRKYTRAGNLLSAPRISRPHELSKTVYMYTVCCVVSEKK